MNIAVAEAEASTSRDGIRWTPRDSVDTSALGALRIAVEEGFDELDRRVPCGDTRPLNSETQSNAQVGEVM